MTHTRLIAAGLAASTILLLAGCGSDGSEAADPAASATAPAPASGSPTADPTTPKPDDEGKNSDEPSDPDPTTPSASSSTLIDYEATEDDGILISTAADTSKLKGAPAEFKTYLSGLIAKQAANQVEGCTEAPQISVSKIDTGGWARGNYFTPGCGGSAVLWATSGGAWTQAWTGQSLVDCATLDRYAFPSKLAGNTCDTGTSAKPYTR